MIHFSILGPAKKGEWDLKCPKCHNDNPDTSRFCGSCAEVLNSEKQPLPSFTKTIETPAHALSKDSLIAGKYRIVGEIGRGGMGVVYKAEDIKLRRTVALKFLPAQWTADPDARERFVHEAQAASALDHPNICNVHEIEETEDGRIYIAMACYEGESLRDMLKRGPLPPEEALKIAIQAAEGMSAAHAKGIVHRDIKPANMLIAAQGIVKVVDFGLAKLAGQVKLTREGTTLGTVAYMSPEQARGEAVDQRTDIWSLGVVLYEMLAGVLPFAGKVDRTLINAILHREPAPLSKSKKELPAGLENIVFKALRKNPSDRYQQMDEMLTDLQAVAEGLKPLKARSGIFRGRILGVKKTYAYPALVGTVVLAALAILFVFPKRGQAFDSIAVLPLANLSGDPNQDYFSDGVHSDLILELMRIRSVTVINKTSTLGYKGTTKKASEIAADLHVDAVVDGSVRYSGGRVRITVELIDGRTNKNLWAGNFEGANRDTLTLQSEAALAIAKQIRAALTPEEKSALARKRPVKPEALELYLKGKSILDRTATNSVDTSTDLKKSLVFFEQALESDPDFALAHAGTALAYDLYGSIGSGSSKEMVSRAKEAALKALSLDETIADAHLVLADLTCLTYPIDVKRVIEEYRSVLESFPNHALARAWYAINMACGGWIENKESIANAEQARKLDPLNYSIGEYLVQIYYGTREDDKMLIAAKDLVAGNPHNPASHAMLAFALLYSAQFAEARAAYEKSIELGGSPNPFIPIFIWSFSGEKQKSIDAIEEYLRKTRTEDIMPMWVATAYSINGNNNKAFEWLEKALTAGTPIANVATDRVFDSLRTDPRYKLFLKKLFLDP